MVENLKKFKGVIANRTLAVAASIEMLERKYKSSSSYSEYIEQMEKLNNAFSDFENGITLLSKTLSSKNTERGVNIK